MMGRHWGRWLGVGVGILGGFLLGYSMVLSSNVQHGRGVIIGLTTAEGLIFGYLAAPYCLDAVQNVDNRLKGTPLPDLMAGVLGLIIGLVVAVLIGFFVRDIPPYGLALSTVLGLLLALTGANLGLHRRAELVALLTGKDGERASNRIPAALLDTSLIIDGRILELGRSGFIDWRLVVPRCVLQELQHVADSADSIRRGRGRRGLEVLTLMQEEGRVEIEFTDDDPPGHEVDAKLIKLAKSTGYAIFTTDFNLNRVAKLEGIRVLNLNDLGTAMRPIAIPGEELTILVVKAGKEAGQGLGYLDDGTMVVVEQGRRHLNQSLVVTVTSVLQTAAGRMIFAQPQASPDGQRESRAHS